MTENNAESKKTFKVSMYIASGLGAFVLCVADLIRNNDAATVLKLQEVIRDHFFPNLTYGGFIAILMMVIFAIILTWINIPRSKSDAFARGLSVFALLTVSAPFDQPELIQTPKEVHSSKINFSEFNTAYAQDVKVTPVEKFSPNATIVSNRWISSCKPGYSGLLGLGSFFNNTVKICTHSAKLESEARVQLIEHWDTGLRKYRYVHIKYKSKGKIQNGWIPAGRKPHYWHYVRPDDKNNPYKIPVE